MTLPAQRRGSLYVEKWGEGREASREEGGKKCPLPVWPSPRPTPPSSHHLGQDVHGGAGQHILHGHRSLPIRLGFQNLHQLLRFLIECFHQANQGAEETAQTSAATGTSPGLRTSCAPLSEGRPVCRVAVGAPPSLSGLPLRPSSQDGAAVIKLSLGFHQPPPFRMATVPLPLVLMVSWVLCLPLGPSTLTPRRHGNVETPEDSGKEGKKGLWGLLESMKFPLQPLGCTAHSPYLPCLGPPSAAFCYPISLSVLEQS